MLIALCDLDCLLALLLFVYLFFVSCLNLDAFVPEDLLENEMVHLMGFIIKILLLPVTPE